MYSPKIDESLIPKLYRYAKAVKKPMTAVVSNVIREFLDSVEVVEETAVVQKAIKKKIYTVLN